MGAGAGSGAGALRQQARQVPRQALAASAGASGAGAGAAAGASAAGASPAGAAAFWSLPGRRHWLVRLAVCEPDVEDRMLHGVKAGTVGKHPAGEDALDLSVELDFVHLDEG